MKKDVIEEQIKLGIQVVLTCEANDIIKVCNTEIKNGNISDGNINALQSLLGELEFLRDPNKEHVILE